MQKHICKGLSWFICLMIFPSWIQAQNLDDLREIFRTQLPVAVASSDSSAMADLLSDDFERIDSFGNWSDKDQELRYLIENSSQADSVRYDITQVRLLSDQIALASGKLTIKGQDHQGPFSATTWISSLLSWKGGKWVIRSMHESGLRTKRMARKDN